jgi:competence protein ComEA
VFEISRTEKYVILFAVFLGILASGFLYFKKTRDRPELSVGSFGEKKSPLTAIEKKIRLSRMININTAGKRDFEKLPGIGPVIAGRIVSYRDENGPFLDINGLKEVKGIGPAKFEILREYLSLE